MSFSYGKNNALCANNIVLSDIVKAAGTPCYIYNGERIVQNLLNFEKSLSGISNFLICYALKANSTLGVLQLLAEHHCGAECVSAGEIRRAVLAGIPSEKIIFDGVGKTNDELQYALNVNIKQINAESEDELSDLNMLAAKAGKRVSVALRINTDTDAPTHKYLKTGRSCEKFGLSISHAKNLCEKWEEKFPNLIFSGFTSHLGSQITSLEPYTHTFRALKELILDVQASTNLKIRTLDLGGGIGIPYDHKSPTICLKEFGELVKEMFLELPNVEMIFEPGRQLVGDAGCLVTTVIRVKTLEDGTECAIVDASMNDLLRPALYEAHHEVLPLQKGPETNAENYTYLIAGPICESTDVFRETAPFAAPLHRGDQLAIMDCGAYGFSMASRYNSRSLPAEIMVSGAGWKTIGKRETLEDALKREICCFEKFLS